MPMNRTTRSYADEIRTLTRQLDKLELRDTQCAPSDSCAYPLLPIEDRDTRVRAFFLESLLTALTTKSCTMAVRCLAQAYAYSGQEWAGATRNIYSNERDILITARNRIEDHLANNVDAFAKSVDVPAPKGWELAG